LSFANKGQAEEMAGLSVGRECGYQTSQSEMPIRHPNGDGKKASAYMSHPSAGSGGQ
jgi:hypothetical protein